MTHALTDTSTGASLESRPDDIGSPQQPPRPPEGQQRPVTVTGPVQRGDQRGRTIGFRTLNLPAPDDAVDDGVWAGWVRIGEGDRAITLAAAISIGTRATFYTNGGERLVEAHLPAFSGDLYDQTVTVTMCTHLRGQQHFGSVDELAAQLRRDVAATLEWWRTTAPAEHHHHANDHDTSNHHAGTHHADNDAASHPTSHHSGAHS